MAEEIIASEVAQEKDWTVLAITGRLDRATAHQTGEQAESLLASNAKFAIDVKRLSYLSSAGIRILLRLAKKAKAMQKPFAICGAEGFVKEVIEESNMNTIVNIYQGREQLE